MKSEDEVKKYLNELVEWYRIKKDGMAREQITQYKERVWILKWVLGLMDKSKTVH